METIPTEFKTAISEYISEAATLETFKVFHVEGHPQKVIALYRDYDNWKEEDVYFVVCAFSLGSQVAVSIDAGDVTNPKDIADAILKRM